MSYAEFQATPAYTAKVAGVGVEYFVSDVSRPDLTLQLSISSLTYNEGYAQFPTGELGETGVQEFVTGEYEVSISINGFWSVAMADNDLPNIANFIGKEYMIVGQISSDRQGAGTVVEAFTGVKWTNLSNSNARGGPRSFTATLVAKRRYTGLQWAALQGDA